MVKGGLNPETDYLIVPGLKVTGAGTALDPGDVVIEDTAVTPDGFKKAATAASAGKAGVNVNRVEDNETELEVVVKGRVRVKAEGAIEPNKFVKTGLTGGVTQWGGADAENLKKGYFAGMHDKPVTGSPAKLQDPQTLKAAAANDIIIVDWGLIV
jgi:hypothetical protein